MVTGLVADESGFEVLADGVRAGSRRLLGRAETEFLTGLAGRYARGGAGRLEVRVRMTAPRRNKIALRSAEFLAMRSSAYRPPMRTSRTGLPI